MFTYKGRNTNSDLVEGSLEGNDSGAIADQLMKTGITPTEIKLSRSLTKRAVKSVDANWLKEKFFEKPIDAMDVLLFSRQMYTLLKAGVPIMRALAGLQESSQKPAFAAMILSLRESLDSGRELSAAMRLHPRVFAPFYISMVHVGEMTGMLDETFLRLYDHLEFERDMRERIKTAMRYPSFVVLAMAVAIVIVSLFVIPAFARVFAGFHAELPLMTRILIGFSGFMTKYWLLMLAAAAAAAMGFNAFIKTGTGRYKWDRFKFEIPIAGKIIFKSTLARFARSLALSFKSGMPILQGMSVVSMVVDNEFMRRQIEQMRDGVARGESILRTATATGIFNPLVLQMIAVGEETGELDGMMFEVADMYQREVEYEIKSLSSQIEPILIVFLGILVLILALGIFLPMWDLGRAVIHSQ